MSAAVRPPRTAAARRALLTLLFLGGFLALAVVFGGSANAASGTDQDGRKSGGAASGLMKSDEASGASGSAEDRAGQAGKAAADAKSEPEPEPEDSLTGAELAEKQRHGTRDAAERATSSVMGPFAEGADSAGHVTRPAGEAAQDLADSAGLRELPGSLGLGEPGGPDGRVPGGGDGRGGDGGTDGGSCTASGHGAGGHADSARVHDGWDTADAADLSGATARAIAVDGGAGGEGAPADRLPFQHTPAAPASGTSQYAGDSQGQRGGPHELSAVIGDTGHTVLLRYGAARTADGALTRERAGDVLEFPG